MWYSFMFLCAYYICAVLFKIFQDDHNSCVGVDML